jgi:hypothetical protein
MMVQDAKEDVNRLYRKMSKGYSDASGMEKVFEGLNDELNISELKKDIDRLIKSLLIILILYEGVFRITGSFRKDKALVFKDSNCRLIYASCIPITLNQLYKLQMSAHFLKLAAISRKTARFPQCARI